MDSVWLYSVVSVLIVSAASLLGIFALSLQPERLKRMILFLVSFAVGGLFGDAFIHLLPEAYEQMGTGLGTSLYVLGGILFFFLLEKVVRWRHCHILGDEKEHWHPVVTMNLVGDAAHNLVDGMIIGVSYAVSIPIGITTTIAVLLHEIPQEIGDYGVLVHGGLSPRKALLLNLLSALAALIGLGIALIMGTYVEGFAMKLLPITAGGFIYIAGADLIPDLHHDTRVKTSFWQCLMIGLGIGLMALLALLEH